MFILIATKRQWTKGNIDKRVAGVFRACLSAQETNTALSLLAHVSSVLTRLGFNHLHWLFTSRPKQRRVQYQKLSPCSCKSFLLVFCASYFLFFFVGTRAVTSGVTARAPTCTTLRNNRNCYAGYLGSSWIGDRQPSQFAALCCSHVQIRQSSICFFCNKLKIG